MITAPERSSDDDSAPEGKVERGVKRTKEGVTYRRKWSVGAKFDESDVDDVLPQRKVEWTSFHPKQKKNVDFQPNGRNTPVGNTTDLSKKSLLEVEQRTALF